MKKSKVSNFHEEIPIHFLRNSAEELISRLKPFFNISRLFGIPSISFFENVITKTSLCSLLNGWNLILLTNQIFLLVNRIAKGEDLIKNSAPEIIMRVHVICVHIWSLFYSMKLGSVLRETARLETRLKIYKEPEFVSSLKRKCVLLIVLFVLIGLGLTISCFIIELIGGSSVDGAWNKYAENNCGLAQNLLFHSSITSAYCLISTLITNYAWLIAEFLLALLAIILSEYFKRLNIGIRNMEPGRFASYEIDLIREHHGIIAKMVSDFDDAISSLNLINIGFNIAFIISGFYSILIMKSRVSMDAMKALKKLYVKLGVAIFKLVLSLITASLLHRKAHESVSVIRSWPMSREFQDLSINSNRVGIIHAFLAQLTTNPSTGFTVGKLVKITSNLILLLPLAILTFFAFTRIAISACARRNSTAAAT